MRWWKRTEVAFGCREGEGDEPDPEVGNANCQRVQERKSRTIPIPIGCFVPRKIQLYIAGSCCKHLSIMNESPVIKYSHN